MSDSVTGTLRRRLLVGRRRAHEDVLARAPFEDVEHVLDVLGRERQEVGDDVELAPADGSAYGLAVAHVGDESAHAVGRRGAGPCRGSGS